MNLSVNEKAACFDALMIIASGKGFTTGNRVPVYNWTVKSEKHCDLTQLLLNEARRRDLL